MDYGPCSIIFYIKNIISKTVVFLSNTKYRLPDPIAGDSNSVHLG